MDQLDWDGFTNTIDLLNDQSVTIISKIRSELSSGTIRTGLLNLGRGFHWRHSNSTVVLTNLMDLLFEAVSDEMATQIIDLLILFMEQIREEEGSSWYHEYLVQATARSVVNYTEKIPTPKIERLFILAISRWISTKHRKQLVNYGFKATGSREFLQVALEDNAKSVKDLARSYLDQVD